MYYWERGAARCSPGLANIFMNINCVHLTYNGISRFLAELGTKLETDTSRYCPTIQKHYWIRIFWTATNGRNERQPAAAVALTHFIKIFNINQSEFFGIIYILS